MKDLFGMVVNEARSVPRLQELVGERIATDASLYPLQKRVVFSDEPRGRGAPGNRRLGLQTLTVLAKCYGPKDAATGHVEAFEIAGALSDAFQQGGPRKGSGDRLIYRSDTVSIGAAQTDPVTGEPYYPVRLYVVGSALGTA